MKALEEHKLFEGCSSEFLEVMLREAKRRHIAPGEVLRLADCGSLFLIESGAFDCASHTEWVSLACAPAGIKKIDGSDKVVKKCGQGGDSQL